MAIPRPAEFFHRLSQCSSLTDATKEMTAEYAYLSQELKTLASLKSGFTLYRNFFRHNEYSHPCIDNEELADVFFKRFNLTLPQLEAFNKQHKKQIISDMENLRSIHDVDGYINKAINLLQSQSYINLILALCALTGRRSAEIATSAEFTYVDHHTLFFQGQLKTRERTGVVPYNIPCLHKADILIKGLALLRQEKPHFLNDTRRFHNCCAKDLTRKAKEHFSPFVSSSIKTKDLRSIYAEICFKLFNDSRNVSRSRYYAKVLGHAELDVVTAQSYDDFRIEDPAFLSD